MFVGLSQRKNSLQKQVIVKSQLWSEMVQWTFQNMSIWIMVEDEFKCYVARTITLIMFENSSVIDNVASVTLSLQHYVADLFFTPYYKWALAYSTTH